MSPKLPKAWNPPAKLPKKLVDLAFLMGEARSARKALEAEVAALQKEEAAIKEHILLTFKKDEIEGVKTKYGTLTLSARDVPQIDPDSGGWEAFYAYVAKTKSFELLEKRLGLLAHQERWEAGEQIPGVKKFHKLDVKLAETK